MGAGGWKIRLGPGNIDLLGSGAHRAGGGKIRLGDRVEGGKRIPTDTRPQASELQSLYQLSYGPLLVKHGDSLTRPSSCRRAP